MDIQAVGKGDGGAVLEVVVDVFLVGFGLQFIGHCEHDQVAPCGGFGDAHDLQAFALGLGGGGGTFAKGHDNVLGAAVAQIEGMGMALRAIAEDGDFHVLDEIHVAVAVVIYAHGVVPSGLQVRIAYIGGVAGGQRCISSLLDGIGGG